MSWHRNQTQPCAQRRVTSGSPEPPRQPAHQRIFQQSTQRYRVAQHGRRRITRTQQSAKIRIEFDRINRAGSMPWQTTSEMTGSLPGPSSMIGSCACGSTQRAIARASILLDGMTAPVDNGFSIHERMNCTSSSRRRLFFSTRANEGEVIDARSRVHAASPAAILTGIGTDAEGQDGRPDWLLRLARPSINSLTRLKKLADSGWVSSDDSFSNSTSNSRWRFVRFCGVSTAT